MNLRKNWPSSFFFFRNRHQIELTANRSRVFRKNVTVDSDICRTKEQGWEASLEDLSVQCNTMGWTIQGGKVRAKGDTPLPSQHPCMCQISLVGPIVVFCALLCDVEVINNRGTMVIGLYYDKLSELRSGGAFHAISSTSCSRALLRAISS